MSEFFRCQCKKIICQIEEDTIIIKCRHCKRYVHIKTKGIECVEFKLTDDIEGGETQVIDFNKS